MEPHRGDLKRYLTTVLEELESSATTHGEMYQLLWKYLHRAVLGGKFFRGWLVTALHAELSREFSQDAIRVGAAFELLHEGFLIHDDLIDGDTIRRGAPNLAAQLMEAPAISGCSDSARAHFGDSSALLAGDLAIALAGRVLSEVDASPSIKAQLSSLWFETIFTTVAGELNDVLAGLLPDRFSPEDVVKTTAAKTAKYSFQSPLVAAALLAGSADTMLDSLKEIGLSLGISFQLVDDLLGMFAPSSITGKDSVSDLREGKTTLLALEAKNLPVWHQIEPYFGRANLSENEALKVQKLLAQSDAPARVFSLAHQHVDRAKDIAAELELLAPKSALHTTTEMITERLEIAERSLLSLKGEAPENA